MPEEIYTNSEELHVLQDSIVAICEKLRDLKDNIQNAVSCVGEKWRDDKYEDFVLVFEQYEKSLEDISDRYDEFANRYLPPIIEKAEEYNGTIASR